jgi:phage shock protein C
MTIIAYFVAGWIAPSKPRELSQETPEQTKFWQGVRASPARTVRDVRSRFREIDRRLADVETYVTSTNSRLAREIEQLR